MTEDQSPAAIEALLAQAATGDDGATATLYDLVHGELKRIASRLMAREMGAHTLQTTALVNEAWMRLLPGAAGKSADREHFVRIAARAMRQVLVDHARRKSAKKRQAPKADASFEGEPSIQLNALELLALDEALERLEELDPELHRIVELRFFGGLTLEEVGALMGMTIRQVHRRWTFARGWLRQEIAGTPGDGQADG